MFGCSCFSAGSGDKDSYTDLFSFVEKSCIGKDLMFHGPYYKLPVTYCDYTASGRALCFIEDYIYNEVLPRYGNTHTTTGITSLQTTHFRQQARDIIRKSVNAGDDDAVIFSSSGVTGAVHQLIQAMSFKTPPVVFVGPYEHHSNLLPWKEIGGEVVWTLEDATGKIDTVNLEENLKKYKTSDRPLIGSFSAASNITGILTEVDEIADILHKNGAMALFDYATAAPYVKIDMNPEENRHSMNRETQKDAVFISTHKFVGGPGTPGLLIAKKKLFQNAVPTRPGGGTVISVTQNSHRYYQDIETREEGGTPSIVESIRAGLVFQLKEAIGTEKILKREHELVKKAGDFWKDTPNLVLLGNSEADRLPIFSLLVYHQETGKLLHHNFVCAVLNDVFGIQARGGCACAGPYAEELLGMTEEMALKYSNILVKGRKDADCQSSFEYQEIQCEILKPGFTRLNLPYFLSDEGVKYVLSAVKMVADHAWKLMSQYDFNKTTAEWRHKNDKMIKHEKCIDEITYGKSGMKYPKERALQRSLPSYKKRLKMAKRIFKRASDENCTTLLRNKIAIAMPETSSPWPYQFDEEEERLRWFLLPSEAFVLLNDTDETSNTYKIPFTPRTLRKTENQVENSLNQNKYQFQKVPHLQRLDTTTLSVIDI